MKFFGLTYRFRHFFSDSPPRRGRHVLAPRHLSDPATLPKLHRAWWILPAPPAASARRRGLARAGKSRADSDARVFAAPRECAERDPFDARVPAQWLALPDIWRGCDRTPAESRGRDRQATFPMSAAGTARTAAATRHCQRRAKGRLERGRTLGLFVLRSGVLRQLQRPLDLPGLRGRTLFQRDGPVCLHALPGWTLRQRERPHDLLHLRCGPLRQHERPLGLPGLRGRALFQPDRPILLHALPSGTISRAHVHPAQSAHVRKAAGAGGWMAPSLLLRVGSAHNPRWGWQCVVTRSSQCADAALLALVSREARLI